MIDILDQPEDMQVRFLTGRLITPDANGQCSRPGLARDRSGSPGQFRQAAGSAGYYPVHKEANAKSPTGQDETYTGGGGVSQRLPWGGGIEHPSASCRATTIPITPTIRTTLSPAATALQAALDVARLAHASHALPYTKNFGDGDDSRLAIDVARINLDIADFAVRGVVNQTLLSIDGLYWSLVGAIQQPERRRRGRGVGGRHVPAGPRRRWNWVWRPRATAPRWPPNSAGCVRPSSSFSGTMSPRPKPCAKR